MRADGPPQAVHMPPAYGPGKTAPRLFTDVLTYNLYNHGINVLAEIPPQFELATPIDLAYLRSSHVHALCLKSNQTTSSPFPVEAGLRHVVSAICEECRVHVEIALQYDEAADVSKLCPSTDNPLHHFRYDPARSSPVDTSSKKEISGARDVRCFDCTNPGCKTSLRITFMGRRITEAFKKLLTEPSALWNRNQEAYKNYPDRFEAPRPVPTPAMVLKTVRQVINGVMSRSEPKKIPRYNARFLTQLGEECMEIMKILGFTPEEEDLVPSVLPHESGTPWEDELAKTLDDWDNELMILITKNDIEASFRPIRADSEFKKLLGCTDYSTSSRRQVVDLTQPEHPMYASLGAQSDFADLLLSWSYKRQKECDPANAPYYFECLTDLATGRKSEDLEIEVVTLRSQGELTRADIKDAYRQLGVTYGSQDENYIIGSFHSRLSDAPKQEPNLREALNVIGRAIENPNIINVSQKVIMSLQQAYHKLEASAEADADYIQTLFQFKLNEKREDEETLWMALKLIAEDRRDQRLLKLVEAHDSGFEIMDYDTALLRLTANANMSDDTIVAVYELNVKEFPGRLSSLKGALKAIADGRNSRGIQHYVSTGSKDLLVRGSSDWPVGIENIGNTCYLNSLLQFYFTITPLRDIILNIDEHQEGEITTDILAQKRIGGRKVTRREIEQAKIFAHYLKLLFYDMITSSRSSVRPHSTLPRLALNSVRDESSETTFEAEKNLAETKSNPIIGPQLPPGDIRGAQDELEGSPSTIIDDEQPKGPLRVINDDRSSEDTLIGDAQDPPGYDDQGYIMVDGQGIAKEHNAGIDSLGDKTAQMLQGHNQPADAMSVDDDSTVPLLQRDGDDNMDDVQGHSKDQLKVLVPEPERPPPVPPRPINTRRDFEPAEENYSFGKQQDVTECIGNVMFQIEAALKPQGYDEDGEQVDIIKNLFYMNTTQTLEFASPPETRSKAMRDMTLILDVTDSGRDIYAALDSHFDASIVELEGKQARRYLSIQTLPPILQFQVQRVLFNRETAQAYKSNAPLIFHEKIFLDRYMASEDKSLLARREQSWRWKEELEKLEQRRSELTVKVENLELPEALEATRMYLDEVNQIIGEDEDLILVPPNLLVELEEHKERIAMELRDIDERIKELTSNIAQQFTDLRKYGYRIHSIFIHKGSVHHGHYWIYIYDYQTGVYRKYNDGSVSQPVDENEMYKFGTEAMKGDMSDANPYFLVYVREEQTDMMQAVCRNITAGESDIPENEEPLPGLDPHAMDFIKGG